MTTADRLRTADAWFRRYRPRPAAALRLVCFAHAGGSASAFRGWARLLPETVELSAVQYPGRLDRTADPMPPTVDDLVRIVVDALAAEPRRPVALFGHSLGAVLAYEVARLLEREGRPPVRLVVSGRPPPHRQRATSRHLGSDDELWAEVARLGGTHRSALQHAELRGLVLPVLRHDYRLAETYRPRPGAPLTCPVTAFTGDEDPEVTVPEAGAWRDVTVGGFDLRVFPGDHFYLLGREVAVVRALLDTLGVRAPEPSWPSAP